MTPPPQRNAHRSIYSCASALKFYVVLEGGSDMCQVDGRRPAMFCVLRARVLHMRTLRGARTL